MTTSPDGQLPLDPPVNLVVPDPNLPTVIPIDPDGAQPEILSSKAKAVVGAVLSILGLICGFVASYLPDPWFGIMFGLAGLFNVIGVPLGIYQTRNSVQQITLPPSAVASNAGLNSAA